MNRSVVTHQRTAWCRSHWTTSRCTARSVLRRQSARGGKRVTGATSPGLTAALTQLQPDQKTVGQHHRDRMPMEARPQPSLVVVPAQLALGLFMKLFNGMAPMGIACQLCQRGLGGPIAPAELPP